MGVKICFTFSTLMMSPGAFQKWRLHASFVSDGSCTDQIEPDRKSGGDQICTFMSSKFLSRNEGLELHPSHFEVMKGLFASFSGV